ncbi:hypothetical protein BLA60_09935 [Actinophytocola xinjiangensis]|uniref:Uncharacterized protein n=1 Tax=Actinophytocola xinjiangensis TaxID=485602 RepID=A0A7Z1B0P2_9PSEU|nr:hypothetical protein [Actinophytocola xinjiangensis]OLF12292.1 hypothetical protein BLA60_09935 [Actinophytocola xinjiangensis]
MNIATLETRVRFDRSLAPGSDHEHRTLDQVQDVIGRLAPAWSVGARVCGTADHTPVRLEDPGSLAAIVESRTRADFGFHDGAVELRGATREIVVHVRVHDHPVRAVDGRLPMPNGVTIQFPRRCVEGRRATEFALDLLHGLTATRPLWGAVHTDEEYTARGGEPDFGRCLPGLFAVNYLDERYVDLVGADRFGGLEGLRWTESGLVLPVADPIRWETCAGSYESVFDALGRSLFFDPARPDAPTIAPVWKRPNSRSGRH